MSMQADVQETIKEITDILCQRLTRRELTVRDVRELMCILEAEIYIDLDWDSAAKEKIFELQNKYNYHNMDGYLTD